MSHRARIKSWMFILVSLVLLTPSGHSAIEPGQFHFRGAPADSYQVDAVSLDKAGKPLHADWLTAWPNHEATNFVLLGRRLVLQLEPKVDSRSLLAGRPVSLARSIAAEILILEAEDAAMAAKEAQALGLFPGVRACYPMMQRHAQLNGVYAPEPNDKYILVQWYLENRSATGDSQGPHLNVRGAWPFTRGEGVTIAVADVGVQLTHPDMVNPANGAPHHNFIDGTTNGLPSGTASFWVHGTEVAGLVAAEGNNSVGMSGIAPQSKLASWVIFNTNQLLATDEQLMDAYQYRNDQVAVQNHSWGNSSFSLDPLGVLEDIGMSNAVTLGRGGKGVVFIRAGGNNRVAAVNANEDAHASDPRVIAVGALRRNGRTASFSSTGACLLVGAPSGDPNSGDPGLFTLDFVGSAGINSIGYLPPFQDLSDYVYPATGIPSSGFSGTSASAPQVAGIAALVLSANTNLTYRDVQQILLLSARHFDLADPDLRTNGAGLLVSHSLGYGLPDAGVAVQLARHWSNRPPVSHFTFTSTDQTPIPDAGLRVMGSGTDLPANLISIPAFPGNGPQPDSPTRQLPLIDVGTANTNITRNLTNCGALIQRSSTPTPTFATAINNAANAGAAFVVIYNNTNGNPFSGCPGGESLCGVGGADFTTIPAVFIGHSDGDSFRSYLQTNNSATAQLVLTPASYTFGVTNTLACEHVGVRLQTDHPNRHDLRITLVSPAGTRSILQTLNNDNSPGPVDWTYYSTHHFYESSVGNWRVEVSDESPGFSGNVLGVDLLLSGVAIKDSDADGLDDDWEMANFGTLAFGPKDDPDKDGFNNAREQAMGTNPMVANEPFAADFSRWNAGNNRLSWPGSPFYSYNIYAGQTPSALTLLTNVPAVFPVTEWFRTNNLQPHEFYRLQAVPKP